MFYLDTQGTAIDVTDHGQITNIYLHISHCPQANRPHFHAFIRMQFRKHSDVKQRDFSTIEYLLRTGKRQLKVYSAPSIEDVTI